MATTRPRRVVDTPAESLDAVLARLGVDVAAAQPLLDAMGIAPDAAAGSPVLEAVATASNPDRALRALAGVAGRRPEAWPALAGDPAALRRAALVAGASEALGDRLATDPEALAVLAGDLEALDAATVRGRCDAVLTEWPDAPAVALARVQARGLLRVAARDLLGMADTPAATGELSALADGVLSAALETSAAGTGGARVAVVAMGKLGGRELNYVSDVDVLFVHDGDLGAATRTARRFLALLAEPTPEGRAYEVDANLRPEGRDGPLSRTLDAYDAYYQRWARPWEFQALLKARPVAGDRALGDAFLALAEPYVWPDRLDPAAVDEIQRMKGVVEGSRQVRRDGPRQLKLAPGGLRDIEFAVQLLQLVHGRHDRSLRSANTLAALTALAGGGYVDDGDANLFADAYIFLRTVEHRLQLRRLVRTHTVPRADRDRHRLARATGFRDIPAATALQQFDREYARVQAAVRRLHEQLFYRPLLSRFAQLGADDQLHDRGDGTLAGDAAADRLAALGFADPVHALSHLHALAGGVSRRAQLFRTLLPALLPTLAASADPDGGLAALRSLAERLAGAPVFLRTLRDNPPVGELLAQVLGRSRRVGEWLERQPDAVGALADLPALARPLTVADYRRQADGLVRRGGGEPAAADGLRRLRRREAARTAVRDLTGRADLAGVMAELTGLAQACLSAAAAVVVPDGVRLAVIGLGTLGAAELGYSSDLDVLLVFEPAGARTEALDAVERLLRLLSGVTPEGQAFRVDVNLRPEGKDGPLARTLESSLAYYERWGEPWELQALTQARPVAGDAALGDAFVEEVSGLVYADPPPATRLQAVRRMKARVERERAGEGARRPGRPRVTRGPTAAVRTDVKLGPGGMSDVEWTVQLLQLAGGGADPGLRGPGTLRAVEACGQVGLLDAREAQWLREGWTLLGRVRNALYLGGARDADRLPAAREDRERLARLLGYPRPGAQAFTEDLERAMRRIRKVHERAFYET